MRKGTNRCCIRGEERDIVLGLRAKRQQAKRRRGTERRTIAARAMLRRGRAMLDSVRVRLTLWYTGLLALFLVLLSLIRILFFGGARCSEQTLAWQSFLRRFCPPCKRKCRTCADRMPQSWPRKKRSLSIVFATTCSRCSIRRTGC